MKAHPVDPVTLARLLAADGPDVSVLLDDMFDFPEIYYADHVAVSRERKELPLSQVMWCRACRIACRAA